jgi:hypothetical protein
MNFYKEKPAAISSSFVVDGERNHLRDHAEWRDYPRRSDRAGVRLAFDDFARRDPVMIVLVPYACRSRGTYQLHQGLVEILDVILNFDVDSVAILILDLLIIVLVVDQQF